MNMAPLQVILLLLIIRLPAILATSGDDGAGIGGVGLPGNVPAGMGVFVVLSFLLTHLALVIQVWRKSRAAVRQLNEPTTSGADVSHGMDRLMGWARWATIGITAIHLYVLHLPAIIDGWLAHTVLLKQIPLFAETLYFIPPFLAWVGFWAANYQVEAAIRERSFPYRLAQGLPAHPMPSLSHYLSMQIRHNFYLLALIGIASLIEEIGARLEPRFPHATEAATILSVVAVILMVPWLITRIWTTVPLRGPLRNRLDGIASQYKIRFRNILIWKTHNQVTNAAILGPVRFARYFLMTDALLEQLTDQQIEAVFAHEIGHGVHKHILWYISGIFGAIFLSMGLTTILCFYWPAPIAGAFASVAGSVDGASAFLSLMLIALFVSLGFSFVSHRFEHQADWFAANHMSKVFEAKPASLPMPAAALMEQPDPTEFSASIVDVQPSPPIQPITVEQYVAGDYPHSRACRLEDGTAGAAKAPGRGPNIENSPAAVMGTEVFISSLDTLVELSHRSRNKRGWMHPSINNRVALLRKLAIDPGAAAAFRRRMVTTRLIIAVVIALGAAAWYVAAHLERRPGTGIEQQQQQESAPRSNGQSWWI